MNKRIKELQAKAFSRCMKFEDGNLVRTDDLFEEFAELIIRECSELTLDFKNSNHYHGWMEYRNEIKRHFGVDYDD